MRGLELAAQYFKEYGRALIETEFAPYADRIAAGLVGQGSERYGFDDAVSRDHDYCAGFCLWISSEDDALFGFALEKAYRRLASEFSGVSTREKERGGSSRYGVITFDAFFEPLVGPRYAALTPEDYLYTPSHYLADASNGAVFYDRGGTFTRIYESIRDGMPEDVRLKKLAAALAGMAQSGQYNYARTLSHGEQGAAVLALDEFVRCAAAAIFLLNRRHAPYYKWLLRALADLQVLGHLAPSLEYLLTGDNDDTGRLVKAEILEDICAAVVGILREQGLSEAHSDFLEDHAQHVMRHIVSPAIRNLHLMEGAL